MDRIEEIVKLADERLKKEIEQYIIKKAIGYLDITDGVNQTKNFIMVNANANIRISSSFGNTTISQGRKSHLGGISKNAPIVRTILSLEKLDKSRTIKLPNGRDGYIKARAEYIPNENKRVLQDGYIDVEANEPFLFYSDLLKEFDELSRRGKQLDIIKKR